MNRSDNPDQNILLVSPEKWSEIKLSKHHYSIALSNLGYNVYFLNPPSKNFKILEICDKLSVVDHKPLFPGLRYLPSTVASWLISYELKKLEQRIGVKFNIVWNFEFSRFFNVNRVNDSKNILHIVDYDLITHTKSKVIDQAVGSYGCAIGISDAICTSLKQYRGEPIKIGHGYNSAQNHGAGIFESSHDINLGYIGNLLIKYIDWGLIQRIVTMNTSIGFHFVGPMESSNLGSADKYQLSQIEKIKRLRNAYFHGPIEARFINSCLSQFDVLLITYLADKYPKELANPHKVLEYLGSGKVIVSTYTSEYAHLSELIEMAEDSIQFIEKFIAVVTNLDLYNSENLIKKRIEFAQSNDYSKKVEEIFSSFRLN